MNFTDLSPGLMSTEDNPRCGHDSGSEVHFILKSPSHGQEDLVAIQLGDQYKIVLGSGFAKLYRLTASPDILIHKVSSREIALDISFLGSLFVIGLKYRQIASSSDIIL